MTNLVNDSIAWTWYWDSLGVKLHVTSKVAATFWQYRQNRLRHERGGQLFVDPNRSEGLVLVDATPPHPRDKAGWSWLELDDDRCSNEIARANGRGLRLVGYWHTHPESIPHISRQDIKSFKRLAMRKDSQLPQPLAVIVGRKATSIGSKAWSILESGVIEAEPRLPRV